MTHPIEIRDLVKTFGNDAGAGRARPRGQSRGDPRLPRSQRRGQVHHDPGPARPAARPTPARSGCSAATRGTRRPSCTAGSPTCPARSTCGPTSPAARSSTCSAGCAAGSTYAVAPSCSSVRARPDQEGAQLLQGQPAEGRPGRRAGLRRRAAGPRRADLRPGPDHGVGLPDVRRRVPRPRATRCCCPATSSPRSSGSATGSASSGRGVCVESGTLGELRHLTRTSITAELAAPPVGLERLAGVHDLAGRRQPGRVRDRHRRARRGARRAAGRRGAVADQPAADPRGAVPAPLRRRDRRGRGAGRDQRRRCGGGRRPAAARCGSVAGRDERRAPAAAAVPAPGPLDAVLVDARGDGPLLEPGGQRRPALHEPGGLRPRRGEHGGQRGASWR